MISSMRSGGSEQQTLLLLQHLDRSRFTPHLYLSERAGDLLPRIPDDVIIHAYHDESRTPVLYVPGQMLRRQTRHLADLLKHESIEVVYDRTFHMTMIAGPAARRWRIPRISTIVSPPEFAVPMVESRFIWLKRRRLARAYRQSHRVLAVSRQAADSAERFYRLPSGSTDVIRNPVDQQRLVQLSAEDPPPRDDRLTLVCVARMTEEKGHRDLLTALRIAQTNWPAELPPLRLWLVGDGPLRRQLESDWSQQGGPFQVEFLGKQENPAKFIKTADALVLPSLFEGMPNVVLEAMALRTPVIATRVGGTLELQRDQPTILWAEPSHPASLANAILDFATHREAAVARADAADSMIKAHHDVQKCVGRIESHLLQACEEAGHS
ncbi:MAG: glycosyltransferase [Planctomycetes bacterium]|nr:glycosyltransferase [Planctomycetota bacterium]